MPCHNPRLRAYIPARALSRSTRLIVDKGIVNRTDFRSKEEKQRYGGKMYNFPAYARRKEHPSDHHKGRNIHQFTHVWILLPLYSQAQHRVNLHLLERLLIWQLLHWSSWICFCILRWRYREEDLCKLVLGWLFEVSELGRYRWHGLLSDSGALDDRQCLRVAEVPSSVSVYIARRWLCREASEWAMRYNVDKAVSSVTVI